MEHKKPSMAQRKRGVVTAALADDSEAEGGRCAWEELPQRRLLVSPALHTQRTHLADEAQCQAWCEQTEHCIG